MQVAIELDGPRSTSQTRVRSRRPPTRNDASVRDRSNARSRFCSSWYRTAAPRRSPPTREGTDAVRSRTECRSHRKREALLAADSWSHSMNLIALCDASDDGGKPAGMAQWRLAVLHRAATNRDAHWNLHYFIGHLLLEGDDRRRGHDIAVGALEGKAKGPRSGQTTHDGHNVASALARLRTTYDPPRDQQQGFHSRWTAELHLLGPAD